MPSRFVALLAGSGADYVRRRQRSSIGAAMVILPIFSVGITLAPPALADSVAIVQDAVASLRSGTSCGPLHYSPVVAQAADIINRSTDDYLDQNATHVPIADPLPGLKDLGYAGNKAVLLQGAKKDEGSAIKGALLQGYNAFPDCSYRDFGASIRRNATTGYDLIALVLAGG